MGEHEDDEGRRDGRSQADHGPHNHGLGGLWQIRVRDLREWHVVEIRCADCKHVGHLSQRQLLYWLRRRSGQGPGASFWAGKAEGEQLVHLAGRLRCRRCGNREENTLRVRTLRR